MLDLEQGHFWPQGYSLNNLGRGPLDKAVYQIWKNQFQIRFLKVSSLYKSM